MEVGNVFSSFSISSSGLTAQRKRLEFIANNIANAGTTRTDEGGPYRRMDVMLTPRFDPDTGAVEGVEMGEPLVDNGSPRMVFDPGHPDANTEGFVAYPNVDIVKEMVSMVQAVRAYEANVEALNAAKTMMARALDIAK